MLEHLNPLSFLELRAQLDAPPARILTWQKHRELLHPHNTPPDDLSWPSPTCRLACQRLFTRAPQRIRALWSVIAADMALLLWDQWVDEISECLHEDSLLDAPFNAVCATYKWLETCNESTEYITKEANLALAAARATRAASLNIPSLVAFACFKSTKGFLLERAVATTSIASAAFSGDDTIDAVSAMTWGGYSQPQIKFLADWWLRCQARSAVAEIELEGQ